MLRVAALCPLPSVLRPLALMAKFESLLSGSERYLQTWAGISRREDVKEQHIDESTSKYPLEHRKLGGSRSARTLIRRLMSAASNELCAHGYTPSGNQFRAYQECLKTTLDDGNNNKNFVQATPCLFSFPAVAP